MTPNEVLSSVRNQVYESDAGFWTDAEVYDYMSQAEQEIADIIECTETIDSTMDTVAGTQEYSKPSNCQIIKFVRFDNVLLKNIDFREKDALNLNRYGSTDQGGDPDSYYEYGSVIGLYPIPQRIAEIKIYYIALPPRLTISSTTFAIPALFHSYLVDYCLFRMYMKDQDDQRGNLHRQIWEENLNKSRMKWMRKRTANRLFVVKNEDAFNQTELGMI